MEPVELKETIYDFYKSQFEAYYFQSDYYIWEDKEPKKEKIPVVSSKEPKLIKLKLIEL